MSASLFTARSPVAVLFRRTLVARWGWVVTAIGCNLFAALFEGVTFGVLLLALKLLSDGNPAVITSRISAEPFHGWAMALSPHALFATLILAAVLLQALRSSLAALGTTAAVQIGWSLYGVVQRAVFDRIMRLSFSTASRFKAGDLADLVVSPGRAVSELTNVASDFLTTSLTVIAYIWLLFAVSVPLTIVSIVVFGLAALAQKGLIRRVRDGSIDLSKAGAGLTKQLVENIHALRVIHTFHRQEGVVRDIDENITEVTGVWKRIYRVIAVLAPLGQMLTIAAVGGFLIVGVFVLQRTGTSTIPALLTFTVVVNRLATRVATIPPGAAEIARHMGQLDRLSAILSLADTHFVAEASRPFEGLRDGIEFREVSLRYDGTSRDAVAGLTFVIPARRVTAIVGGSGAGKSTIADLLLRLYDPTGGAIVADGSPIDQFSAESWRRRLGVVSQDTFLFNRTIRDNIRFGMPDASNEMVVAAARIAHADEFIDRLPLGYDTIVGEGGQGLSGGQRQRLSLARAILRQPEILILDEATSALDSVSERLIQRALDEFAADRTVVVIAHRLSTIRRAHQILFIENGRLVERGSHQELIGLDGRYARYWELQSAVGPAEVL